MSSMQIVIVGINGALNSGDQTLCDATIRLLRETFSGAQLSGVHRSPELQERFFPGVKWLPQIGVSYSDHRIPRRLTNLWGLGAASVNLALGLRKGYGLSASARGTYQALAKADLVVGCAGGWLEDHYVSIWTNLVQLGIASVNRVPVFIAPQSIGPFRRALSLEAARRILSRAVGVTVREEISLGYARELDVAEERLRVFPDLALFERNADHEQAAALLHRLCGPDVPPLAGTTLMPWTFPGASNPAAELEAYLEKVAATARLVYQRTGMKTLFLRQIRDDKGHTGDGELVRKVAERARDCGVFCPDYLEPALLRGIIARCQVFWGTRLHSNIFAATQRVPVVAIAYQHKAMGIMKMLGMGDYVVRIEDFDPTMLAGLIQDAMERRDEWRGVLDRRFADLQPEWGRLQEFLAQSVGQAKP